MRVALIHDWLTGMRGGEKALEAICEIFPDADLFTLMRVPGATSPFIERRRVRTSFIQRLPLAGRLYRHYLPLFPAAIEQFGLDDYDLVVSCSHCAAKAVVVTGRARHLCYCLTPMRYAWDQFDAYFGPDRVGAPASRLARPVMAAMARWDRATASRVHRYLAISQYVARRIALYYNRRSTIVYPPVQTDFYAPVPSLAGDPGAPASPGADAVEDRFLMVSALVPYKRVDLAILAARRAGVRLTIVGDGPDRAALEALAGRGQGIELLGWLQNHEIRDLYRTSIATILPGEEDFGIVPLEAQACGRPVVAYARGGALETVVDGETGVLFQDPTDASLAEALSRVAARSWDGARIRAHAERFSRERFARELNAAIDETLAAPPERRW
ncbi:MAG: glycosyltransferase [Acidobacteriota bacterium]